MVSKEFTIENKMGFHMRPANVFVTEMTKYASSVNIIFNGKTDQRQKHNEHYGGLHQMRRCNHR